MKIIRFFAGCLSAAMLLGLCACHSAQEGQGDPPAMTTGNRGYTLTQSADGYLLDYDFNANGEAYTSPMTQDAHWTLADYPRACGSVEPDHSDCSYDYHRIEAVLFSDSSDGLLVECIGAGAGSRFYDFFRTVDGGASWTYIGRHQLPNTRIIFSRPEADTLLAFCGSGAGEPHMRVIQLSDLSTERVSFDPLLMPTNEHYWLNDYYYFITGADADGYDIELRTELINGWEVRVYYSYSGRMDMGYNVTQIDASSPLSITFEEYSEDIGLINQQD